MTEKKKKQPEGFAKDKNAFAGGSSTKKDTAAKNTKQRQSGAHQPRDADKTSGHDVQKSKEEPKQPEPEQTETRQPEQKLSEPQPEPIEPKQTAAVLDLEDEDEIIDLGDERDQVLAEMKLSLKGERETEHEPVKESIYSRQDELGGDKFTYYVIEDLSARAGNNPEKGEVERFGNLAEAIARFKECREKEAADQTDTTKTVFGFGINGKEFDVLYVKNNQNCVPLEFTQEEVENSRFKSDLQILHQEVGFDRAEVFRERLPEETKDLVKELYELQLKFSGIKDISLYMDKFDMLYEQGEMENLIPEGEQNHILENIPFTEWKNPYIDTNVREADKIEPQKNVVEEFKAKTDELFHEISEMNPSEIEETVKCHVQAKIDEFGINAEIVDVAVVGSRCRGLERKGSDLDVVVELSTNEREDVLFDTFNEGGLHIGGIIVDINPITAQRTGTLETYLPKVEEYLDGVREARENEPISLFNIRMNDEERWFKNTSGLDTEGLCRAYAECNLPFVDMGQYGEQIDIGEFARIEQGERLDFSVEFNAETDRITIFDKENHEEKELRATLFPEQAEPEVTLTVAECGEFHNLGEFYENIPTVDEAIAIWKQIPPERMNGIPAIGISIHKPGD